MANDASHDLLRKDFNALVDQVAKLERINAMKDKTIMQQTRQIGVLNQKIAGLASKIAGLSTQLARLR